MTILLERSRLRRNHRSAVKPSPDFPHRVSTRLRENGVRRFRENVKQRQCQQRKWPFPRGSSNAIVCFCEKPVPKPDRAACFEFGEQARSGPLSRIHVVVPNSHPFTKGQRDVYKSSAAQTIGPLEAGLPEGAASQARLPLQLAPTVNAAGNNRSSGSSSVTAAGRIANRAKSAAARTRGAK
jgi:hypothetical protein